MLNVLLFPVARQIIKNVYQSLLKKDFNSNYAKTSTPLSSVYIKFVIWRVT